MKSIDIVEQVLHAAAELGHVDIVNELLERDASLMVKDDDEYTPLMLWL